MNTAAAAGCPVSAAQLERWRAHGLLPRPRVEYRGRAGTRTEYPPGTEELVLSLARHAGPRRTVDDLALMAFFDGAPVPEDALKLALARTYFTGRHSHEDEVAKVAATVPPEWRDELSPRYEEAEAEARLDLERGGRAIRQMRVNLRHLPELARAPRRTHACSEFSPVSISPNSPTTTSTWPIWKRYCGWMRTGKATICSRSGNWPPSVTPPRWPDTKRPRPRNA
ncbi:hypothetical protein ACFVT5_15965 [Streptomyces sp. NPDC058001]|uniref:hypothetical protein n=1 Tax=Streptomyces sp. NPDC058001 TaxID=3346300 RepID=UPI0036E3C609